MSLDEFCKYLDGMILYDPWVLLLGYQNWPQLSVAYAAVGLRNNEFYSSTIVCEL